MQGEYSYYTFEVNVYFIVYDTLPTPRLHTPDSTQHRMQNRAPAVITNVELVGGRSGQRSSL